MKFVKSRFFFLFFEISNMLLLLLLSMSPFCLGTGGFVTGEEVPERADDKDGGGVVSRSLVIV